MKSNEYELDNVLEIFKDSNICTIKAFLPIMDDVDKENKHFDDLGIFS